MFAADAMTIFFVGVGFGIMLICAVIWVALKWDDKR